MKTIANMHTKDTPDELRKIYMWGLLEERENRLFMDRDSGWNIYVECKDVLVVKTMSEGLRW